MTIQLIKEDEHTLHEGLKLNDVLVLIGSKTWQCERTGQTFFQFSSEINLNYYKIIEQ